MDAARSGTRPYRLGAFVDSVGWVEHTYGRVWQHLDNRLLAAPDHGHIELIRSLIALLDGPFNVAYSLLVPRDDSKDEGRFELVAPLTTEELSTFLGRYRELFEDDGRHDLLITGQNGEILYDQHNVMYLSGPIDRFEPVLNKAGLREAEVAFPSPHSHHYHEELDSLLDDMLERFEWKWYPG